MGRHSYETGERYDAVGSPHACYFCAADKTRGWDYTPLPAELPDNERGVKVRACVNCMPKLHYHVQIKGRRPTLQQKVDLMVQGRRSSVDPALPKVRIGPFVVNEGLLVPSDMQFFVGDSGVPEQFFVQRGVQQYEHINREDLIACQAVIAASLLGLGGEVLDRLWEELDVTVGHDVYESIKKRLVESP